ncbi:MAG: site-specific DNA-methyltransferase [Ignavibacteriae bacterium]|nr:site-specific DNA-methyltransferase [Ignavibacteriota bacterium]
MTLYESLKLFERNEQLKFSRQLGLGIKELDFYNNEHILPEDSILNTIESVTGYSKVQIMLKMRIIDSDLLKSFEENAEIISDLLGKGHNRINLPQKSDIPQPTLATNLGSLYEIDCLELLKSIDSNTIDMIFADPPFNLDKFYASQINDNLDYEKYIKWSYSWIDECVRVLKPGGSIFIWNLPKWGGIYSTYLQQRLCFKHWISVDIKYRLPINKRLYPSHYSLLYFVKGATPNVFKPDRLPMATCPKCFNEIKDYGGYKNKMNPNGINLSDVWYDIPPVRHSKYKNREEANELSIKLLDRIIEMSTNEGDIVLDPFGGSGTTFVVSEIKNRRWIGCEIGPTETIVNRFSRINNEEMYLKSIRESYNKLFTDNVKQKRMSLGLWTDETFNQPNSEELSK